MGRVEAGSFASSYDDLVLRFTNVQRRKHGLRALRPADCLGTFATSWTRSMAVNDSFRHHWDRIIEFLKPHYAITKRTDTAFWRDNAAPESIPDSLKERLELWRQHPPAPQDFAHAREVFSWPSYQYVLHGMGFETQYPAVPATSPDAALAPPERW